MDSTTSPDEAAAASASVLRRFTAAEARLYPLAVVDPDSYQRAATLVGMFARQLRSSCPDVDHLLELLPTMAARVTELAAAVQISLAGLDPVTVADAAAALRYREVLAKQAGQARQRQIDAAREAGERWIQVDGPDPAASMQGSYRSTDLHVRTQTLLVQSIALTASGSGGDYGLELLPTSESTTGLQARAATFDNREEWLAATERWRADVEEASQCGHLTGRPCSRFL